MCGILAVFARSVSPIYVHDRLGKRWRSLRELAFTLSARQRHRGPDHTGVAEIRQHGVVLVQERLSIVGVKTGDQPLASEDGNVLLVANAEIYNYMELAAMISKRRGFEYIPRSDCDVILALYEEFGESLLQHIKGMFAFVLYDARTKEILVARDPIGIIPLYRGVDEWGNIWFASEMKSLVDVCTRIGIFEPGNFWYGAVNDLKQVQFFQVNWMKQIPSGCPVDLNSLEDRLVAAVRSHLNCDQTVPFGALLSGGVDSSIIAAIATNILRETDPNYRLKTYSVGLLDAPDFKYSQMVAAHLQSDHTEIVFCVDDALDYIREIVYNVETYDVATVRCSIPMTIMARAIKAEGIKMILSGEGADELFGGYLYFQKAPDTDAFHREMVKRVLALHYSECQRANKSTMAYGIELRVPFLDTDFVDHAMSINPDDKWPAKEWPRQSVGSVPRIEKHILRQAFAKDYLPAEVLWRQKEQLSDGVGYAFIDTLRETTSAQISDVEFARAAELYPFNTPSTKEAFYYRMVFEELFPGDSCARTVQRWVPRLDWGCSEDPSGRAQLGHAATYTSGTNGSIQ